MIIPNVIILIANMPFTVGFSLNKKREKMYASATPKPENSATK